MGVSHGRHPIPLDHLHRVLESVRVGGRGVEGGGAPVGVDKSWRCEAAAVESTAAGDDWWWRQW